VVPRRRGSCSAWTPPYDVVRLLSPSYDRSSTHIVENEKNLALL
jgi:hypothetical protein